MRFNKKNMICGVGLVYVDWEMKRGKRAAARSWDSGVVMARTIS
jgi:hypothetical protein